MVVSWWAKEGSVKEGEQYKVAGMLMGIKTMNDRNGNKQIIKDTNRGTIYAGPLLVLINGFSASASEFFANAMQDYNRAIIVGNQSHGKASIQRIMPLSDNKNPDEFIKLTIEKFYRITGKSNQTIGITPDVIIPSLFDKQMPREKNNPTALKNDEINAVNKYSKLTNDYAQAIALSKKRVAENSNITAIANLDEKINALYDTDFAPIPLQFDKVFDEIRRVNSIWKDIKTNSTTEYPLNVERNSTDIDYQQFDDYLKTNNKEKIKAIKCNIHIVEAVNIINDLKK